MSTTEMPLLKPAPLPAKWWAQVSNGLLGGLGSFGNALDAASDRMELSAHEINHALQFQLYYAKRGVDRSKSILGRFLNAMSNAEVGYVNFPALHASQVLELAGRPSKPVVSYKTRWLIRIDVAEAALAEIRGRAEK